MARTITDAEQKKLIDLVNHMVEPAIKKIIEKTNKHISRDGLQIGASIEWYFDGVDENDKKN